MNRSIRLFLAVLLVSLMMAPGIYSQRLSRAKPEEVGMSSAHLSFINTIVGEAIDRKDFPGAVVLVGRKGRIIFRQAFGQSQWIPTPRPMDVSMIFDLASVTKPVATATSIMILAEQGRLRLWDKVKDFVPEFSPYIEEGGNPGEDARVWHLLTHTSGLPPYTDAKEVAQKYGDPCPTETLVQHIAGLKKNNPAGKAFAYSCLGYITMGHIVKKLTGRTIAEFAAESIFRPLKMEHTFYNPPDAYRDLCVPTQVTDGQPLVGVVHDPLARLQGGISGNAGLFSTADDLAVFAQMMLNKGIFEAVRILSPLTVERMTAVYPNTEFAGRGLGWDLHSGFATVGGDIYGPNAYGHSGYTGTSIWIDPDTQTFVIFLTNRVHPDDKGDIISMRSKLANVVASSIR
jgi:CubicO group peptidase (beta-lactamase class C family)